MDALHSLPIPGWDASDRQVSYVGHGESFDAWKIDDASGALPAVLARIARRTDLPKPMENEVETLRQLEPTGVAPILYTYDADAENALGAPYMVTSFVNGAVKPPAEWSLDELGLIVDAAARLHAATARPGSSSGVGWFEGSIEHWRNEAPAVIAAEPTSSLLVAAEEFVRTNEYAFDRLEEVSLVHGDLITGNVLLDGDVPRFVDWEWAEVDDAARDLALLGGQTLGGEYYAELGDADVSQLLDRYAAARSLSRAARDDLAVRRDVWMVMDRLFSSIHAFVTGDAGMKDEALAMQRSLAEWLPKGRAAQ